MRGEIGRAEEANRPGKEGSIRRFAPSERPRLAKRQPKPLGRRAALSPKARPKKPAEAAADSLTLTPFFPVPRKCAIIQVSRKSHSSPMTHRRAESLPLTIP